MIDFSTGLVYFDCRRPNDAQAQAVHAMYECGCCDGDGSIAFYVGTLFDNLAIAGGLAASAMLAETRYGGGWEANTNGDSAPDYWETVFDQPTMTCPKCMATLPDFDGFGVLAHDACGYCTHPSLSGGVCEICRTVQP